MWVSADLNNPSRNVPYLLQGGLQRCRIATSTWARCRKQSHPGKVQTHIASMLKLAGVADPRQGPADRQSRKLHRTGPRHRAMSRVTFTRPTTPGRHQSLAQGSGTRLEGLLQGRPARRPADGHGVASERDQGHLGPSRESAARCLAGLPDISHHRACCTAAAKNLADERWNFNLKSFGAVSLGAASLRAINATKVLSETSSAEVYVDKYFGRRRRPRSRTWSRTSRRPSVPASTSSTG